MNAGIFKKIVKFDTLRGLVDNFAQDKLDLAALSMKSDGAYVDYDYGQLQKKVKVLGNALIKMGIKKGDKVSLLSENRIEWPLSYLAVSCIGAVFVPLDMSMDAEELSTAVDAGDVSTLIVSGEGIKIILPAINKLTKVKNVICFEDDHLLKESELQVSTHHFSSVMASGRKLFEDGIDHYSEIGIDSEEVVALIYLHGRKYAMLTHRSIMYDAYATLKRTKDNGKYMKPGKKWVSCLPYHHTFPFTVLIAALISYNHTIILPPNKMNLINSIKETEANYLAIVPFLLELLYKKLKKTGEKLDSIDFITTGGAPIHVSVLKGLTEMGIPVIQGYGLTEYAPIACVNSVSKNRLGSSGQPIELTEIKIDEPDEFGNGELLIKGPGVMKGYYKMPELTNEVIDCDGWLHTGDIARMDADNFIFITGRSKRIILTKGGKNIYPVDIERLLSGCRYISESRVVPKIDKKYGEVVHAVIRPDHDAFAGMEKSLGKPLSEKTMKKHIMKEIKKIWKNKAPYKRPKDIEITDRQVLKRPAKNENFMFDQVYMDVSDKDGNATAKTVRAYAKKMENYLVQQSAEMLSMTSADIDVDVNFFQILDSIELARMAELIERDLHVQIDPTVLFEYTNIRSLAEFYSKQYPDQLRSYFGKAVDNTKLRGNSSGKITAAQLKSFNTGKAKHQKNATSVETKEPIAVIGVSGIFPGSDNLDAFWKNLEAGKDLISVVPKNRWDWEEYYGNPAVEPNKTNIKWGGFIDHVDKFDPDFFNISQHEAELMDPQQRIFLQTVWNTIEDGGYRTADLSGRNIAIFVGVATMDYNELLKSSGVEIEGYTATGNAHSITANRISYLMDWHGPSEPVDTACSSSLVAIHRAVESIQRGSCEMAVAGGVNLMLSPTIYISFSKAGMLCEDGRCKTFDSGANGYVRGEGAGAVLLKSLSRAREDGDHIYAVIKGSSINHGGNSNSLTAPNPKAQADLIMAALQEAQVDPYTVTLIEAHGTGTSLGDPIEIKGLKKAFAALRKDHRKSSPHTQYCGVGSVKSNIGHLETAAGVAAFIKVLLSMKHKTIPATIHVKELNPYIKLENSPFYIATETKPWKRLKDNNGRSIPRRAGVSSFGFGGANAHIVIEEYDNNVARKVKKSNSATIIPLSAKNPERLKAYTKRMVEFLEKNSIHFPSMAYTLQTGRDEMEERLAVIASSTEELAEALRRYRQGKPENENIYLGNVFSMEKQRSLFSKISIDIDFVSMAIQEKNLEKLALLWTSGFTINWKQLYDSTFPKRISIPGYPFAKKRCWVPSTDDNISKRLNHGAKLHSLIDSNVSNLEEYCLVKNFSGAEYFLKDHMIGEQMVLPGAASLEMARAAGNLIQPESEVKGLRRITWTKPLTVSDANLQVYVSCRSAKNTVKYEIHTKEDGVVKESFASGELLYGQKGENSSGPEYIDIETIKKRCLTTTDKETCYRVFQQAGLNYGETFQTIEKLMCSRTESLSELTLPDRAKAQSRDMLLHPSILDGAFQTVIGRLRPSFSESGVLFLPFSVGHLEILSPTPIPGRCYAYALPSIDKMQLRPDVKKFNIMICDEEGRILVKIHNFEIRLLKAGKIRKNTVFLPEIHESMFFQKDWEQSALQQTAPTGIPDGHYLIFDTKPNLANLLRERIGETDSHKNAVILIKPGSRFKDQQNNEYEINPASPTDYEHIVQLLKRRNLEPLNIVHAWCDDIAYPKNTDMRLLLERSIYSIFHLSKALFRQNPQISIRLLYFYPGTMDSSAPQFAAVSGFLLSLGREHSNLRAKTIQVQHSLSSSDRMDIALSELRTTNNVEREIFYYESIRYVSRFKEVAPEGKSNHAISLKNKGVYLIAGAMGGLGKIFSGYLAKKVNACLVLTGRSDPDEATQLHMETLKSLGAKVEYIKADIANQEDVRRVIDQTIARFNILNGVIHAAGVTRDAYLVNKTEAELDAVLRPKLDGTVNLYNATKHMNMDFFVLFSSFAAVSGNAGQSDYAYANSFMDHFARMHKGNMISINWSLWEKGGMKIDPDTLAYITSMAGIQVVQTDKGLTEFEKALEMGIHQLIPVEGNYEKVSRVLGITPNLAPEKTVPKKKTVPARTLSVPKTTEISISDPLQRRSDESLQSARMTQDDVTKELLQLIANMVKTKPDKIDIKRSIDNYGIDSMMMMRILRKIGRTWKLEIDASEIINYTTIEELAAYLHETYLYDKVVEVSSESSGVETITLQTLTDQMELSESVKSSAEEVTGLVSFMQSGGRDETEIVNFNAMMDQMKLNGVYSMETARLHATKPSVRLKRQTGETFQVVNYANYNYLGYATHPDVITAAKSALDKYGLGATASPIASGMFDIHTQFEDLLTEFFGMDDMGITLFSSGYGALVGSISAYIKEGDSIILDSNSHACIVDGARLSGGKTYEFYHNDMEELEEILHDIDNGGNRILICTEGVYSADGDYGNLKGIVNLAKKYGAKVLVDEAHSMLVTGPTGRGASEELGVLEDVDMIVGTFSKGFSGIGGFLYAKKEITSYVNFYARNRMFSCALDPAVVGGMIASLKLAMGPDGHQRRRRLHDNARYFHSLLHGHVDLGESTTWVIPVIFGSDIQTISIADFLQREGFEGSMMSYPAVPKNRARIRVFMSSEHSSKEIEKGADIILKAADKFGFHWQN